MQYKNHPKLVEEIGRGSASERFWKGVSGRVEIGSG